MDYEITCDELPNRALEHRWAAFCQSPRKRLLAGIRKLEPQIRPRAGDIEATRRIPPSLVEALKSIGVFRVAMPRSHGGLELDLPAVLEIITALSKIDGSRGWTIAIASGGDLYAPLLPRDTYDEVYRAGADVVLAGSSQPAGTAEAAAGRWRVTGRWPLIRSAYEALPTDGVFIAVENLIDDQRRVNAFGLLVSLCMLLQVGDGFDFTGADFGSWCSEAGFRRFAVLPLGVSVSAAIAYK